MKNNVIFPINGAFAANRFARNLGRPWRVGNGGDIDTKPSPKPHVLF